jgi:hypothetical protein
MIAQIFRYFKNPALELGVSQLHNEQTFYRSFVCDLHTCMNEAVIESPFITSNRIASLLPIFVKMRSRGVKIVVNTRHPAEHDAPYDMQAQAAIERMQQLGIEVLFTGGHHRKLAIIDRKTLWEGSLNILSQNDSCEIMRRIESDMLCDQMLRFTGLNKLLR